MARLFGEILGFPSHTVRWQSPIRSAEKGVFAGMALCLPIGVLLSGGPSVHVDLNHGQHGDSGSWAQGCAEPERRSSAVLVV